MVIAVVSVILAVAVLPLTLYLGLLALLAYSIKKPDYGPDQLRFVIVVPAHNEQDNIRTTVSSALLTAYSQDLRRVLVICDNCSDATGRLASEAGAEVLTRQHETKRGKGYALEFAFDHLLEQDNFDAVLVIDADSVVTPNILKACQQRLQEGAWAVQAEYGVRNIHASWRTKLMAFALGLFHRTRSLARERMGVSTGLRGNGMCFSKRLLHKHPHKAYGLTEDVEYGVAIGIGGHRVAFAHEASVLGEMVSGGQSSVSQRRRWEGGRLQLARQMLPPLLKESLKQRSPMLFDLAMDLLVPPLSYVVLAVLFGMLLEMAVWLVAGSPTAAVGIWLVSFCCLALYGVRGLQHSGLGWGGLLVLAYAPVYVFWKVFQASPLGKGKPQQWQRTQRETNKQEDSGDS